jgi:hypothetical protein
MTINELSQLYYLNREIAQYEARLDALYAKATGTTPALTGMPRAPGVVDKVGKYAVEIADQLGKLELARQRRVEEQARLYLYIEAISDSLTRQIFMLRFSDCLSWEQVADRVGGGNTYYSVKNRVFRYIKRCV